MLDSEWRALEHVGTRVRMIYVAQSTLCTRPLGDGRDHSNEKRPRQESRVQVLGIETRAVAMYIHSRTAIYAAGPRRRCGVAGSRMQTTDLVRDSSSSVAGAASTRNGAMGDSSCRHQITFSG